MASWVKSLISVFVLLLTLRVEAAEGTRLIAFYDPDANHQAILQITGWFNDYLSSKDLRLLFQPVQSRDALERLLEDERTAYAIVASSYLKERKAVLTPLLVPESDGSVFYRKQLLTKSEQSGKSFEGKAIAATVSAENRASATQDLLRVLKQGGVATNGASLIPVSKDIDALLALAFGQVQGALVTPSSVDLLKRLNPTAAADLKTDFTTPPILRSPLCTVNERANGAELQKVLEALKSMQLNDQGRRAMSTLHIDAWVPFKQEMWQG